MFRRKGFLGAVSEIDGDIIKISMHPYENTGSPSSIHRRSISLEGNANKYEVDYS